MLDRIYIALIGVTISLHVQLFCSIKMDLVGYFTYIPDATFDCVVWFLKYAKHRRIYRYRQTFNSLVILNL